MATTGKQISVNTGDLTTAASQIESIAAEYKKQYEAIYIEANALSEKWKDKANTAFVEQITGFKDDFEKMHTLLDSYVGFLKKSAKSYEDTINNAVTKAKSLKNNY